MLQPLFFFLCVLASAACMWLLLRGWRQTGSTLLLWSGLCFVGLTLNNLAVFFDLVVFVSTDLSPLRQVAALGAVLVLLWGFMWETD